MSKEFRPIGWANTIMSFKEAWDSVMTIEGSALRKLDPRVAHMVFQVLAFMWSGIFAVMIGRSQKNLQKMFEIQTIADIKYYEQLENEVPSQYQDDKDFLQ